jgi:predicted ATP-binding protein involved in virulence
MGSEMLSRNLGDPAASLFAEDVDLVDAQEWLLVEDYARSRSGDAGSKRRLQRVRKVFLDLLPDVTDLRIRKSPEGSVRQTLQVKTPYGWVQLSDLSLGYRTMVAWTVDLASRLFELYPESKNPLAEPAVVLVDEVDLHLHPKWQRELREHMVERFPNTQFIVTAHSPLVVQASENENLVVLRRKGDSVIIDNDVETVRGWRVDQVLTSDLFGLSSARPPEYDAVISERNALLNKRSLSAEEEAKLAYLEAQMFSLPAGETPEDIEAMEIIRRAAAQLSKS